MTYKVEVRSWMIGGCHKGHYLAEEMCVTHPDGTYVCLYENGMHDMCIRVNGKVVLKGFVDNDHDKKIFHKRFKREIGISVRAAHQLHAEMASVEGNHNDVKHDKEGKHHKH